VTAVGVFPKANPEPKEGIAGAADPNVTESGLLSFSIGVSRCAVEEVVPAVKEKALKDSAGFDASVLEASGVSKLLGIGCTDAEVDGAAGILKPNRFEDGAGVVVVAPKLNKFFPGLCDKSVDGAIAAAAVLFVVAACPKENMFLLSEGAAFVAGVEVKAEAKLIELGAAVVCGILLNTLAKGFFVFPFEGVSNRFGVFNLDCGALIVRVSIGVLGTDAFTGDSSNRIG
jgi:hypothetical protein